MGLGDADAFGESTKTLGCVAAAASAGKGGHARIVPAVDVAVFDQLDQQALGQEDVRQVQAREFDLLRQRALEQSSVR